MPFTEYWLITNSTLIILLAWYSEIHVFNYVIIHNTRTCLIDENKDKKLNGHLWLTYISRDILWIKICERRNQRRNKPNVYLKLSEKESYLISCGTWLNALHICCVNVSMLVLQLFFFAI